MEQNRKLRDKSMHLWTPVYKKSYKTLMKQIKDDKQMEKYTMFMDQKNEYSENEYTIQSNLQIQSNPYQTTKSIFHRTRTNNFSKIYNREKTISLTSGDGKTGQPLVKE